MGLLKSGCTKVRVIKMYSTEPTITYYCLKELITLSKNDYHNVVEVTITFPKKYSEYLKTAFIYGAIKEINIITREYNVILHGIVETSISDDGDTFLIRPRSSYVTYF